MIFLGGLPAIVERFQEFNARILFSAEGYCWPDKSLANNYPPVSRGKRYLNSGGFIGYASDLYAILNNASIKDEEDDQLFYTMAYLNEEVRTRHKIKLDHKSEIFQNLFGAVGEERKQNPLWGIIDIDDRDLFIRLLILSIVSQLTWSSDSKARKLISRTSSTTRCLWCFTATDSASSSWTLWAITWPALGYRTRDASPAGIERSSSTRSHRNRIRLSW